MWRSMIGLQFQLIAEVGMKWYRGNSELFLKWYDLYRRALKYRGLRGNDLQSMLRKALGADLI